MNISEYIFESNNLTKAYKNQKVLFKVNIKIKKGDIYGLIGQNGAGKTTLMRIICGLIFPTSGFFNLMGREDKEGIIKARLKLGSIIEGPAYYGYMSASENLDLIRIVRGIKDSEIVKTVLNIVGLNEVGDKKVKSFSLGMRQRLGLACALLGKPEFIILDEPINGLDPIGIIEFRKLIKKLNSQYGITF